MSNHWFYKRVTFTRRIHLDALRLSADDWQLYHLPGREEAAERINGGIIDIINNAPTRAIAGNGVSLVLKAEREWGAIDTEPLDVASQLLDHIYGDQ